MRHAYRSENITSAKKKQIQKIDTFLNDLMHGRFPGDVAVKENTNYWSGIASFTFNKGGNSQNGYAVALFQPTQTSNVWLYDATGSRELTRTSHDLNDIAMGINLWLKGNYYVSGLKWIDQ
jgi:hypothetical protein